MRVARLALCAAASIAPIASICEATMNLPKPDTKGTITFEQATTKRRSIRSFADDPLTLKHVSQILWAAQGITDQSQWKKRTTPSAGALYPLELYLVVGKDGAKDLDPGCYHYIPDGHKIEKVKDGDLRELLCAAALGQQSIRQAPVSLVICAVYERTRVKYGDRTERYVHIEVGHVGQNVQLEAVCLGLGSVTIGAFEDDKVGNAVGAPKDHAPLYIIPIGKPR
jgi:SagB-type dehydrogenase family enzyme